MIYLDSCIVIYAAEDGGPSGDAVRRRLVEAGEAIVAISPLVILECLVGPLRDDNLVLRDHYEQLFEQFRVLDLDPKAYRRAAELRAAWHPSPRRAAPRHRPAERMRRAVDQRRPPREGIARPRTRRTAWLSLRRVRRRRARAAWRRRHARHVPPASPSARRPG
ncbi:PIN domain-containing protein [Specibacter cremeus]|uniref:type II toxin-antitoxin system VapC family toxin n=1 Tax=Specibacter cremeus TaxID=1629051 RepID=UPI0013DDB7A9